MYFPECALQGTSSSRDKMLEEDHRAWLFHQYAQALRLGNDDALCWARTLLNKYDGCYADSLLDGEEVKI